jgi:hypothetical protein
LQRHYASYAHQRPAVSTRSFLDILSHVADPTLSSRSTRKECWAAGDGSGTACCGGGATSNPGEGYTEAVGGVEGLIEEEEITVILSAGTVLVCAMPQLFGLWHHPFVLPAGTHVCLYLYSV